MTSTTSPGNVLWPLTDNLGTVRDVVDFNETTNVSQVANHLTYDSFGRITAETNAAVDFLFAFTGRERDEETGLYFYRARYYDPATGRFLSQDPIGFEAGDANLYRYVQNGPTNATDPSGLQPPWLPNPFPHSGVRIRETGPQGDNPNAPRGRVRTLLQEGEAVPSRFQPGGPSDLPERLLGTWRVSICAGGHHAWIRYENVATHQVHTAGRYMTSFGERADESGNIVVPPVAVAGVQ